MEQKNGTTTIEDYKKNPEACKKALLQYLDGYPALCPTPEEIKSKFLWIGFWDENKPFSWNDNIEKGFTVLHIAAKTDNKPLVKFLIENENIELEKKNNANDTPRSLAIRNNFFEVVKQIDLAIDKRKNNNSDQKIAQLEKELADTKAELEKLKEKYANYKKNNVTKMYFPKKGGKVTMWQDGKKKYSSDSSGSEEEHISNKTRRRK